MHIIFMYESVFCYLKFYKFRYSGSLVIDIRPETNDSPLGPSLFHKNLIVPSARDNTLTYTYVLSCNKNCM
jgi:hypothetical protein